MKIYTEVIYTWDDNKGELVEESSKSFDYDGEVTLCHSKTKRIGSKYTGYRRINIPHTHKSINDLKPKVDLPKVVAPNVTLPNINTGIRPFKPPILKPPTIKPPILKPPKIKVDLPKVDLPKVVTDLGKGVTDIGKGVLDVGKDVGKSITKTTTDLRNTLGTGVTNLKNNTLGLGEDIKGGLKYYKNTIAKQLGSDELIGGLTSTATSMISGPGSSGPGSTRTPGESTTMGQGGQQGMRGADLFATTKKNTVGSGGKRKLRKIQKKGSSGARV